MTGEARCRDALHVLAYYEADELRGCDTSLIDLRLFEAAAAQDDHRFQQLGTSDQSEQRVFGVVEIFLDRVHFARAMLQMIAELAESVGDLASSVLHRVAHDRAIDFFRRERRNLPIHNQQESRQREVDRDAALRILVGPEPFLEALLRGHARASKPGA